MNEEATFWFNMWRLAAITFCVVITAIAGCTSYQVARLADAKDPLALACAMNSNATTAAITCIALVKSRGQQ
jgi:hypothetical protein